MVNDGKGIRNDESSPFGRPTEMAGAVTVGFLESVDKVEGESVSDTIDRGDVDAFRFSGNVDSLRQEGGASVVFEDNDG